MIQNHQYKEPNSINDLQLFSCENYKLKKRIEFADGFGNSLAVGSSGTFAIIGGFLFVPKAGVDDGMHKGSLWKVDLKTNEVVQPMTSIIESPIQLINNVSINATG